MNPLLAPWTTAFGIAPFAQVTDDDWRPAVEAALVQARANLRAIATNAEPPDFANTIAALETATADLDRIMAAFDAVAGADTNPVREALERDFAPLLADFASEITSDRALFARIEALWQGRDALALGPEEARVLLLTRRRFVRGGALLEGRARERLTAVMARLAELGTRFSQNVLADERDWFLPLTGDDMAGLPDFVTAALTRAGEGRGGPGVTLARSVIVPFLQFSPRRDLRARAHAAWIARGANGGATDNRAIAAEMLALREERARLLGHDDFASFKLEPEMAGNAAAVRDLLMQVWAPARAAAERDGAALTALLHADGHSGPLEPWDWHHYAERRRRELHDIDEAVVKPFLTLERMIAAMFWTAGRLFRLEFAEVAVPLYHPDARAFEVTRDRRHVALFVGDWFNRPSKHSGAWCTHLRAQSKSAGEVTPIVLNVCNFAPPPRGEPALLSWDDARTLFHEFGHALHQMLSDVTYESVSGTSVARDFVELPSQLYEHWLEVPELLDTFATHAVTGQPMPADLRDRLIGAARHDMGFQTVEYLASALVDLAFHEGPAPADPMQRQAEVLAGLGLPRAIPMRHATPHFAHVFAGDGYSCGYYSYMWAEVMDADAFDAFREAGDPFDPALAQGLEAHILSRGGSGDAAELYTRFRGRMPGVGALLRGRGLLEEGGAGG
ncbi:MAG: M3 family metallopeptidase [Rubellimicrobium sp.]|nr:M3 family metallopeptidase [Rubellimicrobium sp.]